MKWRGSGATPDSEKRVVVGVAGDRVFFCRYLSGYWLRVEHDGRLMYTADGNLIYAVPEAWCKLPKEGKVRDE